MQKICIFQLTVFYRGYNYLQVTEVILPKTLVTINEGAFAYCEQLERVTMYEGVTKILWSAFCGCYNLKSIKIPDSVVLIDQTAFLQCSDLEEVVLSKDSQLQTIGLQAFLKCSSLKSFYVPKKVLSLNNMASDCSIRLNGEYSSLGYGAFYECTSLKSIIFENTLTKINGYTFQGCMALTDVYYTGTKSEWNAVTIGTGNGSITSATMHYNYVN